MPDPLITLRYRARCTGCDRELPATTPAHWSPRTRAVTCVDCAAPVPGTPPPPSPRHAPDTDSREPAPVTAGPGELDWRALVRYHLACVARASLAPPPLVTAVREWTALPLDVEQLLCGRSDALALTPPLSHLAAAAGDRDGLFYGWPLLVVRDRRRGGAVGGERVAPLFVTRLQRPSGAEDTVLAAEDEPVLNPSLLVEDFFPADALAAARAAVADGLAFGDPTALAGQASAVLGALGLDGPQLDPDRLQPAARPTTPGVHNSAVAYRGPVNAATQGLLGELEQLLDRSDWRETAARWLLEPPPPPEQSSTPASAAPQPLNDSQEQALTASAARPVTVVTGPPGTGKSHLVATAVAAAWLRGETVLVASTNNTAVDEAVGKALEMEPGLLVRTGNRRLRDTVADQVAALAARPGAHGPSADVTRRHLEVAAATRAALLAELEERAAVEAGLAQTTLDLERWRQALWGAPGPSPVEGRYVQVGRRAHRVQKARLLPAVRTRRLLAAAAVPAGRRATPADLAAWADGEHRWTDLLVRLAELTSAAPVPDRARLADAEREWVDASREALRHTVAARLAAGTAALQQLTSLRSTGRAARTAAVRRALPAAAGWACTTLSAAQNFPLTPGLFDLVIVDEASQCSIAEVLAVAYRAKRIMIVGDPNQLAPVVTLDARTVRGIAESLGTRQGQFEARHLAYGTDSAYTAYEARTDPPFLLEEHYRCHPDIAAWLNDRFYAGRLQVLTDVTRLPGDVRGLVWEQVRGRTEPGPTGSVVNHAEADAVVAWVLAHRHDTRGLGVVTPFAAQADLIERRLRSELGRAEYERCAIAVGTAHRFQGGERDVVLFSTVLSEGASSRTAGWVQAEKNLVNVAVSRARRALVVIGDAEAHAALGVPVLDSLAAHARAARLTPREAAREDPSLHSEAERRLLLALRATGLGVESKVVVDGYEVDFAVRGAHGVPIDVECDGVQHLDARGRRRRRDLARDRVLERQGWTVLRYPAWRCLSEPAAVAADVVATARTGGPGRRDASGPAGA